MKKEDFKRIAISKKFPSGYHHVVYLDRGYIETFLISEHSYDQIWRFDCSEVVDRIEYLSRIDEAKKKKTTMWIRDKK